MATSGIRNEIAGGSPSQVEVVFRFQGNGTSSPTVIRGASQHVASVTRTPSTGRYTITLAETWAQLEGLKFEYQDTNYLTSRSRKTAVPIAHDVTSAKTITLAVEDASDGAANALSDLTSTQWVHVFLTLRNSSQGVP